LNGLIDMSIKVPNLFGYIADTHAINQTQYGAVALSQYAGNLTAPRLASILS
jgi:hypothetical protein